MQNNVKLSKTFKLKKYNNVSQNYIMKLKTKKLL